MWWYFSNTKSKYKCILIDPRVKGNGIFRILIVPFSKQGLFDDVSAIPSQFRNFLIMTLWSHKIDNLFVLQTECFEIDDGKVFGT